MGAHFYDLQDPDSSSSGTPLESDADLRRVLRTLEGRPPFFGELVGDNGVTLLIGVGPVGCAQISATDGSGVARVAVAPGRPDDGVSAEFLIGGTATPVHARHCVPFELALQIAITFVETGTASPGVLWETV